MEQSNISLQYGIHRTPSLGPDGELSECVNLIPQNGELVNIQAPVETGVTLQTGEVLLYIHNVSSTAGSTSHYITYNNRELRYFTPDDITERVSISSLDNCKNIISAGNILAAITANGVHRWLWKEGEYRDLGANIPELPIQFGLKTEYIEALTGEISTHVDGDGNISYQAFVNVNGGRDEGEHLESDETQLSAVTILTESIFASLNPLITSKCTKKDKFGMPFFVRYAYKLYDESYAMCSAPVLMTPYTIPQIEVQNYHKYTTHADDILGSLAARISMLAGTLDYAVTDASKIQELANWKDIISSVDIFVSSPLYFYKPDGRIKAIFNRNFHEKQCNVPRATVGKYTYPSWIWPNRDDSFVRDWDHLTNVKYYDADQYMPIGIENTPNTHYENLNSNVQLRLPVKSAEEIEKMITQESTFYKIASIDIENLSTSRVDVPIEKGALEGLDSREVLVDNPYEHDDFIFDNGLSYNNRLILYSAQRTSGVFNLDLSSLIAYTNAKYDGSRPRIGTLTIRPSIDGTNFIEGVSPTDISYLTTNTQKHLVIAPYLYLPDKNIQGINLLCSGLGSDPDYSTYRNKTVDMRLHDFLPGVYHYFGFDSIFDLNTPNPGVPITSVKPTYSELSRIYISDTDSPFIYQLSKSVSLNVGKILSISSSAKALSQGQFGQFPLYAFCDDGIWALEIANDGLISAKQPVSRDVCVNPKSVTQIDNAVVFVTNQGLKLISGSDVTLLSGPVEGLNLDESFIAQAVNNFAAKLGKASPYVLDNTQFIEQIKTAKIVYDYAHNLLHVFHDPMSSRNKHYVYSFDTNEWSTQVLEKRLITAVPGYPLTTMQLYDNKLYQYEKVVDASTRIGYALTRPLSLGNPLARKALYDLRVVGQKTDDSTLRRVAVFVSNDNINWTRLTSLKALSAKYYRFLIMTNMTDIDTISGLALQHEERYNHKMRGH